MKFDANDILRTKGRDYLRDVFDGAATAADQDYTDDPLPNGADTSSGTGDPGEKIKARPYQWVEPQAILIRQWLYDRHLIRGFPSATIAPGGVGKTSLIIAEALALASGRPILGRPVTAPRRVWYWNLEDPEDEIARRIQAACLHYGLTRQEIEGRLFVSSGRDQPCIIARAERSGTFVIRPVTDKIVKELTSNNIDVLTIDPFVSCHTVSENDNTAIDLVVKEWGRVAGAANCAVELVHHSRKLGDAEATAESARGASALVAACRSVRVINRMSKDEGTQAGVDNPRLYFRTHTDKLNLAPPADGSDWYRLLSIDLGNGPPGHSDLVGVVVPWSWPSMFADMSMTDVRDIQKRIASGSVRADVRSDNWAGKVVAEVLGKDLSAPENRDAIKKQLAHWIKTGALKSVSKHDGNRKAKEFIEVGTWL